MNRYPGYIHHLQAVPPGKLVERRQREVAQVLVIDRVELHVFDKVLHVGRFNYRHRRHL